VIGVHVRVERFDERQIELLEQREIARDVVLHRVDDQRLPAAALRDEIAEGAGLGVVELAEQDHALHNCSSCANIFL
jgi:hypothetical protein